MKHILLGLVLLAATPAFARDSLWTLCQGTVLIDGEKEPLVVNLLNHRSATPDQRETAVAMIFGMHVMQGQFDSTDKDAGQVVLSKPDYTFTGVVDIDYNASTVKVQGDIKMYDMISPLAGTLKCKDLPR